MTFAPFGHQRESLPPLILWSPFSLGTAASHRHANSPKPGLLISSVFLAATWPVCFLLQAPGWYLTGPHLTPASLQTGSSGRPGPLLQPQQPNGPQLVCGYCQ